MERINLSTALHFTNAEAQRSIPKVDQPVIEVVPQDTATNQSSDKKLPLDQLDLSEEAKAKSAEASTAKANNEEQDEDKKNIDASKLSNAMTPEEAAEVEKTAEGELDKRIRELSMEILDLSVKIQMLQVKEDKESVKERQKLEVDLAMKKGELEAAMDRKLQLSTLSK
jgi:hypothetical protein